MRQPFRAMSFAHAKDLISFHIANVISNDVQYCLLQQEYAVTQNVIIASFDELLKKKILQCIATTFQSSRCASLASRITPSIPRLLFFIFLCVVFSFEHAFVAAPSQPSSIVTSSERAGG